MRDVAPQWGDDYNRRADLVQLAQATRRPHSTGSRIEQIQPISCLPSRAGVEEYPDNVFAVRRDAVAQIGRAARVFGRRKRPDHDDLIG